MNKRCAQYGWIAAVLVLLACRAGVAMAQANLAEADDPMQADVLYTVPESEKIVEPPLVEALKKAAAQPDQVTRLQTLAAISEYHLDQLADQVKALLGDERVLVRTAAVHAAAALKLTDTAATMRPWLTSVKADSPQRIELLRAVDRALQIFGDAQAKPIWAARSADVNVPAVLRVSTIQSLAALGESADPMIATRADEPAEVRMAVAEAYEQVNKRDYAKRAPNQTLRATYSKLLSGSLVDRLVAARMLSGEVAPPSQTPLLQRAAGDKESAVQAIALEALKQRGAEAMTMPIIEAAIKSDDPKVRQIAVEGLAMHPQQQAVDLAAGAMNDPHPDVRAAARASLATLDKTDMSQSVRQWLSQAVDSLGAMQASRQMEFWGEAEQVALLARDLHDTTVAEGLTKLLGYPRPEVTVAAIKVLRVLDVPQTHDVLLAYFTQMVNQLEAKQPVNDPNSEIARQAAMTLGVWRMNEADKVLRHGISKQSPLGGARPATIWALGLIHEGQYDGSLGGTLAGRINDTRGQIPESEDVRQASVITLGRMKGKGSLGVLRQHLNSQEESSYMQYACQWAIQQITGKVEAAPPIAPNRILVPFLSPLRS